jgi:hypothetical protein
LSGLQRIVENDANVIEAESGSEDASGTDNGPAADTPEPPDA